ncbi:SDR family oxidoreductase [Saccharopolyspora terrae]|uniref:SDR family oxidoreductase n=1 Tax=Saccharopolyspora terrae TaxID=2530384 RepID=UPI001A9E1B35|nr:hypothetical protein [Saccharopolyspora terrae]
MKIAIAGGTGLVGSKVVAKVRAAGHEPVVIARSHGTNLITGEGLLEALRDCRAMIDVSNVVTTRKKVSIEFFSRATATLLRAARQADVDHLVTLSIVGCDAVDLGYYFGKRVSSRRGMCRGRSCAPRSSLSSRNPCWRRSRRSR